MPDFALVTPDGDLQPFNPAAYLGDPVRSWAMRARPGMLFMTNGGLWVICLISEELEAFPRDNYPNPRAATSTEK